MLLSRHDARGEWVVACDVVASNLGVRRGMPLAEAVAGLCEAGPHVRRTRGPASQRPATENPAVLPYDPAADRAALGRLAERCEQFSPVVGWDTIGQKTGPPGQARRLAHDMLPWFGESPGQLFLDVTGIAPLFGGEQALARLIDVECREAGYFGHVAIADTVGAAWAVAVGSRQQAAGSKEELSSLPAACCLLPAELPAVCCLLPATTEAALRPLSIATRCRFRRCGCRWTFSISSPSSAC